MGFWGLDLDAFSEWWNTCCGFLGADKVGV